MLRYDIIGTASVSSDRRINSFFSSSRLGYTHLNLKVFFSSHAFNTLAPKSEQMFVIRSLLCTHIYWMHHDET